MLELEAIYIPTKEHVGYLTVGHNDEVVTFVDGREEYGFQGPFANVSWHTRCDIAEQLHPDREDRPNAMTVPNIEVVKRFPRRYGNLMFIKHST